MISKEQLNNIAKNTDLNLYQQEKDYFLKLFLYFYYKKNQEAVFKGGTCLKYLLNLPRFSEDLDFNVKNSRLFREQVKETLQVIEKLGLHSFFLKEEEFPDAYACEIGFWGPLYNGTAQTQNKFRIDAGYRTGTFRKPEWKLIKSEYPETPENFLILVMDEQEIFAEKVIALFQRKKGRDLFDLWFLIQAGIKLDKELLQKKLKREKVKINFNNIISQSEYERDMSKLASRMIPYGQVKKDVERAIERK